VREALSNPIRRKIVMLIMENPGVSIRQLARLLGLGPGALAGHLAILQRLGLVREERNGRRICLYIDEKFLLGGGSR